MIRRVVPALLVALLAIPAAAGPLAELEASFQEALASKDVERFLSFWAEDGTVFTPGAPAAKGREAILAFWKPILENEHAALRWTPVFEEVASSGDLGFTHGSYVLESKGEDGAPATRTGKYLSVWRKGKDGRWRVVADIGMPDPAPEKP